METKTQSPVVGVGCLPFRLVMPLERLASRLVLRSVSRPVLLACLIRPCGPHRLIRPHGFRCLSHPLASSRRLIGSPLPRIARLPVSSTSGTGRSDRRAAFHRRAAVACLPRMATGCGRSSTAAGCGRRAWAWLLACLGTMDGAARSFLDRFSFLLIGSSNRRGPGSSPSSHHLIDGGGVFFSFSPDPLPPALLGLLAWGCSPVPGRGMRGLRHGLRRRACGLFACVLIPCAALSLPLVRSLLYDLCQSCRSFLPGVLWGVLWIILPAILSALAFLNICP